MTKVSALVSRERENSLFSLSALHYLSILQKDVHLQTQEEGPYQEPGLAGALIVDFQPPAP